MLDAILNYNPATIDPAIREQMARLTRARSEYLAAQSEILSLRARAWGGEDGLADIIDLKMADISKLRQAFIENFTSLFKNAVDVEGLLELLPSVGLALLQKLNVPLPVLLEASGADLDAIKLLMGAIKEFVEDL